MQQEINEHIVEMLEAGVIEPSSRPWSSPVILTWKKDGQYRLCVDYYRLNQVTDNDANPHPQINATLDKLRGAMYFSKTDFNNEYWFPSPKKVNRSLSSPSPGGI
jgi:hypothetical protein